MRAIVTGMIGTYPVGGVAWDYGQYALGLEKLGYEVYYLEDTGRETYDADKGEFSEDCSFNVRFLKESLAQLSPTLGQRWHFRALDGSTYGIAAEEFGKIVASADLFLNVSGGTLLRDDYMGCPCKVLIDSDPGWNHFVNYPIWDATPGWQGTHGFRGHDHFFTYAQRIGTPECNLPLMGIKWQPTRPPVVVDRWEANGPGFDWTTVMTWNTYRKPIVYENEVYGSKEVEFPKIETLPRHLPTLRFELAVGGTDVPTTKWREQGWHVVDSHSVSRNLDDYQEYIQKSRGEFSVAKNLYTATHSGWFSCRTVCYLAAGRPCVVQDTGFTADILSGEGLVAWSTLEEARSGIEKVESDYTFHSQRAREIAYEYFESRRVLGEILSSVGQ